MVLNQSNWTCIHFVSNKRLTVKHRVHKIVGLYNNARNHDIYIYIYINFGVCMY